MRKARESSGLASDGDILTVFRSPLSIRADCAHDLSFGEWGEADPLPDFENAMEGFFDRSPPIGPLVHPPPENVDLPFRFPDHAAFSQSNVMVPITAAPMGPPPPSSGKVSAPVDLLELQPRQPWMLDGDPRDDAEADSDWRRGTGELFSTVAVLGDKSSSQPGITTSSPSSDGSDTSEVSPPPTSGTDDSSIPASLRPWPKSFDYGGLEGRPRFTIHLTFPNGELCDQDYAVSEGMSVRLLERRLAWLLCDDLRIESPEPPTVFIFVHPRWTYD